MQREDIDLKRTPGSRGQYECVIDGEVWAIARPGFHGSRGMSHTLCYPGGMSIRSDRREKYRVAPYPRRHGAASGSGVAVASQEDAIRDLLAEAINGGHVDSPTVRRDRREKQAAEITAQRAADDARQDRIIRGAKSMWGIALNDDERFALGELFHEWHHKRLDSI